jgi:hypothetical protein
MAGRAPPGSSQTAVPFPQAAASNVVDYGFHDELSAEEKYLFAAILMLDYIPALLPATS